MSGVSSAEDLTRAVRAKGVRDERVLDALRRLPRAAFVPAERAGSAYVDEPVPIAHDQTSTQPWLSARMFEALELSGTERVLEVGTGSGFATALLAQLASEVVTIDRWRDMVERAERTLAEQGVRNVTALVGDGSAGVPDHAPFDGIAVSAACPHVPAPLAEQLRPGGRIVLPIGPGGQEQVTLLERSHGGLVTRETITPARFVRLQGRHA
ncbi:protein-L-isoaspartate(D-aspartate) O-methyltransferase [Haloechinothrix sp. YIM 98757]|uniref:Protein-L-isoaspartate O-methyltransferase n=1 Tax=Haloechinothrix aidingensis TaxID=2752311 RepID=A0A838A951_9PSEU|nr:protein-L-isoaspartate(D-aspartate) O-methyltransferase [Haloechinothrix aidingensis]MBA0126115.1 protein-L-isoaspartate(D-aspartate) O-methyltransferase [Haloechinothrix aidingensis]